MAGAQQTGEIGSTENPELIARHIFFSYSAAIRWWLAASENPDWRSGLRDFAAILKLQTTGIGGCGIRAEEGRANGVASVAISAKGNAKAARRSKRSGRLNVHTRREGE